MSEANKLTAERVEAVFMDCLFRDGEDTTAHVLANGITVTVGFHPGRLGGHKADIEEMLSQLPDPFMKSKGGGYSFLSACEDRNGVQWGQHRNMEQLFQLGIGIGKVICLMPRDMWSVLPGGMPYYVVEDDKTQVK